LQIAAGFHLGLWPQDAEGVIPVGEVLKKIAIRPDCCVFDSNYRRVDAGSTKVSKGCF
jgi:hypothetical protein